MSVRDLIIQIFGNYEPITYEVASGTDIYTVVPPGAAGVNWEWVAGVVLFGITLYMVLSIIRSVIYHV